MVIAVFSGLSPNVNSIASLQVEHDRGRRRIPDRDFLILNRSEETLDPQRDDVVRILTQRDGGLNERISLFRE